MNVALREHKTVSANSSSGLLTADCDIHPRWANRKRDLHPYLSQRWRDYDSTWGSRRREPFRAGPIYQKGQPNAERRDSAPPGGGVGGSDLPFLQKQLLDTNNTRLGILNCTGESCAGVQNREFGAAIASAANQWMVDHWMSQDKRLKGSLVVPYEDTEASVKEIERWAGSPHFTQVLMMSRTAEPAGQKRYWPIYEAATAAGWPIGVHAFGFGGFPSTGGGWPSYYIEDMAAHCQGGQTLLTSMLVEGVFERIPAMRLVLIETGFSWLPALTWRLDKLWKRLKAETPFLTQAPSEYIRKHVWLTTQPMEEPDTNAQLIETMDWIGWDRLLFATDYPHWDYDDPAQVSLLVRVEEEKRRAFFIGNALKLYGQESLA